jgi:hypothetical protein
MVADFKNVCTCNFGLNRTIGVWRCEESFSLCVDDIVLAIVLIE